eukprot:GHVO01043954.1.p1 GENE.GHVO01043954.1~~GHVO01043954.1.p1  ORF type:complete len:159 (+),score=23.19 GHVO01043954.1:76-552(+)
MGTFGVKTVQYDEEILEEVLSTMQKMHANGVDPLTIIDTGQRVKYARMREDEKMRSHVPSVRDQRKETLTMQFMLEKGLEIFPTLKPDTSPLQLVAKAAAAFGGMSKYVQDGLDRLKAADLAAKRPAKKSSGLRGGAAKKESVRRRSPSVRRDRAFGR